MSSTSDLDLGRYKLGWSDVENYVFKPKKGLSEAIVREMSWMKQEPEWMLKFRLRALQRFFAKPMAPWFAVNIPELDFDDIYYYVKPTEGQVKDWDQLPESIKTTYEKLGIPEAERKYLAGVTAQYECLRGSTRVWTTKGMRLMKELGPGDVVFSLDESSKQMVTGTVVAGGQSGEKEILEITARGRRIGASGNHPFLVLRDERRPGAKHARLAARWVPAEQLEPGDLVAIATDVPEFGEPYQLILPARTDVDLPTETSDDLGWWLGVYLGDGYLERSGAYTTVQIAVDRSDEVLVEEIRRVGWELFGLDFTLAADGLRLIARGPAALAEFLQLNGFGGQSKTKRLPPWVFGLPRSQRLALVAGLLDSDGYVRDHPTSKDAMFCSANEALLSDVEELLSLCGIGSPRRRDRMHQRKFSHGYRTAKGTVFRTHKSEMLGFVPVESIERVGVEPVFDIEVAGHHNFVAEGFVVHNSEVVFHRNRADLEAKGVLFCDMDTAVREYPDVVRKWFGTIIPPNDNKFAALNSAVWSGGSFIYVPPGVEVDMPLQAYFRINAENMGQFERTLIIADEGSKVHYVEGCSAPIYSTDSLHSAVVELVALPSSRITYTTIQNWSNNVYNLVTKRARAEAEAHVEWIDGNIGCLAEGSRVTTPSGVKPIELLVPGEEVLAYDQATGQLCFRTVLAKRFSGVQPVREVHTGERRLLATDNHPFYSCRYDPSLGRYALSYVRCDELSDAIVPSANFDEGHANWFTGPEAMATFTGSDRYTPGSVSRSTPATQLLAPAHDLGLPASVEIRPVEVSDPVAELPTWDIEVEGTGNFVAEGFIVHNSRLTMKYPSVYLMGPKASGEVLSVAYAGPGQHQDAGAKMIHAAPETTSTIVSKSVSKDGGLSTYRGLVRVEEGAKHAKSFVRCDALILDENSTSETKPYMEVEERDAQIGHEATVSKVGEDQLFYLMSRGLSESAAMSLIVNGFIEPVTRTLPMEYAVEWSRLIELQMEGAVG
jgi:Fe-S cluster assembly protein SufB